MRQRESFLVFPLFFCIFTMLKKDNMNEFKTIDFLYTLINNMVWRKDFEVSKQECLDWLSKKLVAPQGLSVDGKLLDGFLYTHFGPNFFDMGYKTPIEGAPKEGDAIDVTVNIIEK